MARYFPTAIPVLPTLTDGVDVVAAKDISTADREIEAARYVLGDSPQVIVDNISSVLNPLPTTVADYMDMVASNLKSITGAAAWYQAAVPLRFTLAGHGNSIAVPGSTTQYLGFFVGNSAGLFAAESNCRLIMPYAGTLLNVRVSTDSTAPAGAVMTVTWFKNGVATAATFTIGSGAAAGTYGINTNISYAAGDTMSVQFANANAAASALVGPISCEYDQAG